VKKFHVFFLLRYTFLLKNSLNANPVGAKLNSPLMSMLNFSLGLNPIIGLQTSTLFASDLQPDSLCSGIIMTFSNFPERNGSSLSRKASENPCGNVFVKRKSLIFTSLNFSRTSSLIVPDRELCNKYQFGRV